MHHKTPVKECVAPTPKNLVQAAQKLHNKFLNFDHPIEDLRKCKNLLDFIAANVDSPSEFAGYFLLALINKGKYTKEYLKKYDNVNLSKVFKAAKDIFEEIGVDTDGYSCASVPPQSTTSDLHSSNRGYAQSQFRKTSTKCFRCGRPGHFSSNCEVPFAECPVHINRKKKAVYDQKPAAREKDRCTSFPFNGANVEENYPKVSQNRSVPNWEIKLLK